MSLSRRYTALDVTYLAVVAAIAGVIFALTWNIYFIGSAVGGPIVARVISYGLWFIGAPLAATLIRKPGSAFLGEFLGALVETLIPTYGAFTNLIYGFAQGLASELAYALFRYRKYGVLQASLSGALAGFPCVALDALLFGEVYTAEVMVFITIAAVVSGAIYGSIAALAVKSVRR
ncbi:MAG: ECF transporter S component [Sulfolobales archaeon]|jgi:energy-coupling factor transport system substrate-specific component